MLAFERTLLAHRIGSYRIVSYYIVSYCRVSIERALFFHFSLKAKLPVLFCPRHTGSITLSACLFVSVRCYLVAELSSRPTDWKSGARFTKYLTTILRLSYDNAKVTIDSRRTSNLQNILRRAQGFS